MLDAENTSQLLYLHGKIESKEFCTEKFNYLL